MNHAALGFGFNRFALEYKKTPARASPVPEVKAILDHLDIKMQSKLNHKLAFNNINFFIN